MSTFTELTEGTGMAALEVEEFFKAIRKVFFPATFVSNEYEPTCGDRKRRKQNDSTAKSIPHQSSKSGEELGSAQRNSTQETPYLILVVHLLPTLPAYLRALKNIGIIRIIIFKGPGESDRPEHMRNMAKWVTDHDDFKNAVMTGVTKSSLKAQNAAIDVMKEAKIPKNAKIIIMDIGGYFAPCLKDLANLHTYNKNWTLLGIVEDTENGHQKYNRELQSFLKTTTGPKPPCIYSVARSNMKMTEDYNVGKSLVRAADNVLRQSLNLRFEDHLTVGVIGFGKIGSSIATHLRQKNIGKVIVYDVNPAIMIRAVSQDFNICSKEQMLEEASFIFCATGNRALTFNDLLRTGVKVNRLIIASCTSADDELDIHDGLAQNKCVNTSPHQNSFSRYKLQRQDGTKVEVILLCNGNATNFFFGAVLGETIRSVQAAMMVCALKLRQSSTQQTSTENILKLTDEEEMTIARLWLQQFSKLDTHLITNVGSADVKLDDESSKSRNEELPINPENLLQLKQYLGLQRVEGVDQKDFMDSKRKLIIAALQGSGKSTVISALIRDVRNYYDFIWWFDCSDSLYGAMTHLAQQFRVSCIGIPLPELQKSVLKAIFSCTRFSNILLVIDNVQNESKFNINAASATDNKTKSFICHDILQDVGEAVNYQNGRSQRRRHLLALYTEKMVNQAPSKVGTPSSSDNSTNGWLFLQFQSTVTSTTEKWICSKIPQSLEENIEKKSIELVNYILSLDTRLLTLNLTASLVGEQGEDLAGILSEIKDNGNDILPHLVKWSLKQLKNHYLSSYTAAQVASLIKTNSISRAVFLRIVKLLSKRNSTTQFIDPQNTSALKSECNTMCLDLQKFYILKKNVVSSMTYTHTYGCPTPKEYLEIYSMPSTYAEALRSSILQDTRKRAWRFGLKLINEGFTYDYHDNDQQQHMQNIEHFFDHAHTLIRHLQPLSLKSQDEILLADLQWRLGSYYLNERRLYKDAAVSFQKAYDLLNENKNKYQLLPKKATKWSAKIYQDICRQLTRPLNKGEDKKSIKSIKNSKKVLEALINSAPQKNMEKWSKYLIEADIATARIDIQHIRNNGSISVKNQTSLETMIKELTNVSKNKNTAIRTRSLVLEILGSAYCLLGKHVDAVGCTRKALEKRKQVLPMKHLDVARTEYKLAFSLFREAFAICHDKVESKRENALKNLEEARDLCNAALGKQLAQLPIDHHNLTESQTLKTKIEDLKVNF